MLATNITLENMWLVVPALYIDAEKARVLVRLGRWQEPVDISRNTAEQILAVAGESDAIAGQEGYEEDETAKYYWFNPKNQFVNLLNESEKKSVWQVYEALRNSGRGRIVRTRLGRRSRRAG